MNDFGKTSAEYRAIRQFNIAWIFLLVTAFTGVLLRWLGWLPFSGIHYGNLLHTHSHMAFLGWVFNAFFALAYLLWVPRDREPFMIRLFIILQVANIGMLLSFPVQGYGFASIFFTTMHMVGSMVFAIQLWQSPVVSKTARPWLRTALLMMIFSGLGPLFLGPLAAMDLRDSFAYPLAIYGYLHFQYNGWFILFPIAVGIEFFHRKTGFRADTKNALTLFAVGVTLTLLVSCLWLQPPAIVYILAFAGGMIQLSGLVLLMNTVWKTERVRLLKNNISSIGRALLTVAQIVLLVKCLLQLAACHPEWHTIVNHRYTAIAFMHAIFLGIVFPVIIAIAWERGWIKPKCKSSCPKFYSRYYIGFVLAFSAIIFSESLLIYPVLAPLWNYPTTGQLPALFFLAALMKAGGLVMLSPGSLFQIPSVFSRYSRNDPG